MTDKLSKTNLAKFASHVEALGKIEEVIHVKGRLSIVSVRVV